ncbi:MAG: GGDEF domain-containing protein [bacterium]
MKNTKSDPLGLQTQPSPSCNAPVIGKVTLFRHAPTDIAPDALIIDTLMTCSKNTIYFKDVHSKFILCDDALGRAFGAETPAHLIGKSDNDFFPEALAKQKRQDEIAIMQTGVPIIDKLEQGLNAQGEILVLSTSKYPLYDYDGKIIGTWGTSRDVTKLVKAEEELAQANAKLQALSLIDDLTGLYNQRHFYAILETTIKLFARKRLSGFSADFCLIFLDIDDFKHINDDYGHVIGDTALRFVSGHIMGHTRSTDTSFRYGGDEYAVILPDTKLSQGKKIAETFRSVIETNPLVIENHAIHLTVSVGIVAFNNETIASNMVEKADAKLYQAKHEGKNRVR